MRRDTRQDRLWTLYRRHPYCWWCGRRVRKFPLREGRRQPGNYATLDHLNSRNMYPAGRPHLPRWWQVTVTVLSCARCNQDRAAAEMQDRDWVPPLMAARGA